jgi:uncharacterized Zn-binding protein involved in type VI secretion
MRPSSAPFSAASAGRFPRPLSLAAVLGRCSRPLVLAALLAQPLSATEPGELLRDVWTRLQQAASTDRDAARPRPQPIQAGADAPVVSLRDLSHPISIEQQLARAPSTGGAPRLTVSGGTARLGDFSVGSDQSLSGDLLVVQGDANIFGRLDGNLVAWHGDVVVHPGAVITGDVLALDGQVRLQGGDVAGEVRTLSQGVRQPGAAESSIAGRIARSFAGVLGSFLILLFVGGGLVLFGKAPLEVVSDTVGSSFYRSFVTGLLGQILVLPTFGMLVVGLILSVAGILLIPFVVIVFALLLIAFVVGGALAVAHAMGESITRRQMAQGRAISPNSYRYLAVGLAGVFLIWLVWSLFGWVPLAGDLVLGAAILVSWLLTTTGFGAALLSRGGLREQFAGRLIPAEMLTDEYLWATPRFGVPAAKRPDSGTTPRSGTPRLPRDGS